MPQPTLTKIGEDPLGGRVAEMHLPGRIHLNDEVRAEHREAGQTLRLGLRLPALQFAGRAYGDQLQYRLSQAEVRPRLAPDHGDQADRFPREPQRVVPT